MQYEDCFRYIILVSAVMPSLHAPKLRDIIAPSMILLFCLFHFSCVALTVLLNHMHRFKPGWQMPLWVVNFT